MELEEKTNEVNSDLDELSNSLLGASITINRYDDMKVLVDRAKLEISREEYTNELYSDVLRELQVYSISFCDSPITAETESQEKRLKFIVDNIKSLVNSPYMLPLHFLEAFIRICEQIDLFLYEPLDITGDDAF